MADKRMERSRKAIETAYIELLKKKDNHDITTADIINTAGYSKTAFYNNYTCKDNLLESIYRRLAEELFETLKRSSTESNGYSLLREDEKKERALRHFIAPYDTVYKEKENYRVLYSRFGVYAIESIMNLVIDMQNDDWIFRRNVPRNLNAPLFGYAHLWDTMGCIAWWIRHEFQYSPEYMGKQQLMRMSCV